MMDDDSLKQLLRSNDELLQLCTWLNERRDMETSSRLISHFRSLGDRFHGTYPPNINEGTHPISVKGPTQYQVVPVVF